jgi:hypothetical protein
LVTVKQLLLTIIIIIVVSLSLLLLTPLPSFFNPSRSLY